MLFQQSQALIMGTLLRDQENSLLWSFSVIVGIGRVCFPDEKSSFYSPRDESPFSYSLEIVGCVQHGKTLDATTAI